MPRFSDDFLNRIFESCDIEQVISPYTSLKRRGKNLVGLCPFHNEKTPSFTVYPETHSFFCFGCGAAGTAIQFVMRSENLDFNEAVRVLCERNGIRMPEDKFDDSISKKRKRMLEINREAARFYHNYLVSPQGKVGLDYYIKRGYSKKTITRFGLGYAPNEWSKLLSYMRTKGYTYEELYEANLANKSEKNGKVSYYDTFRNRVMVPIIDVSGHVVAFGGRVLDDSKPKYVNTSDTLVYKKSKGVFGLNFAKNSKEKTLILVEGYMDAISLHRAGFDNAIACLGTAFTSEMAHLLSRYCDEIILSYDADEAGRKATKRAIEVFDSIGMKIRVAKLVGGKDPDEILQKYGPERFRKLIEGSSNDIEFELNRLKDKIENDGIDVNSDDGKMRYMSRACDILSKISNIVTRDIYISRVSRELEIDKTVIQRQVESIAKKNYRKTTAEKSNRVFNLAKTNVRQKVGNNFSTKAKNARQRIIAILLKNPEFFKEIISQFKIELFFDIQLRNILELIIERINDSKTLEVSHLSIELSPEETTILMRIEKNNFGLSASIRELNDCVRVLLDEANRGSSKKASEMTDEEFLARINKLAKK